MPRNNRIRVVFATRTLLSFTPLWRAIARAIAELGCVAFVASGIAEDAIGLAAPWYVLLVVFFAAGMRAVDVEARGLFLPGGLYGLVGQGLGEAPVIFKHALKNALIPVVTVLGLQVAGIAGGSVIIEWIFGIPGMGQFLVDAIVQRDYPVIQGINLIIVTVIVLTNLSVDLLYAVLDPRIRY